MRTAPSHELSPLGAITVQHRERLDGSGYPFGLSGAYQSMREPRAYCAALSSEEAEVQLRAEVKAGRLDAEAVEAVLAAAGHRVKRRREGYAGLTSREIEVLRLLARGLTNKDIAACLVISSKTVANHVEHIYTKIGASTRTAAGLFATQHGILTAEDPVPA